MTSYHNKTITFYIYRVDFYTYKNKELVNYRVEYVEVSSRKSEKKAKRLAKEQFNCKGIFFVNYDHSVKKTYQLSTEDFIKYGTLKEETSND